MNISLTQSVYLSIKLSYIYNCILLIDFTFMVHSWILRAQCINNKLSHHPTEEIWPINLINTVQFLHLSNSRVFRRIIISQPPVLHLNAIIQIIHHMRHKLHSRGRNSLVAERTLINPASEWCHLMCKEATLNILLEGYVLIIIQSVLNSYKINIRLVSLSYNKDNLICFSTHRDNRRIVCKMYINFVRLAHLQLLTTMSLPELSLLWQSIRPTLW